LPFALLAGAVSLVATWELYRMLGAGVLGPLLPFGLAGAAGVVALLYLGSLETVFLFIALFFGAALLTLVFRRGPSPLGRAAGVAFSLLYGAVFPGFLVLLRELPRAIGGGRSYGDGASYVFLLFLVVWGCDTGAYAVGRIAGRRPLAPSISPKKTVEGALGGLLFGVLGAFAARAWLLPGIGAYDALALGLGGAALGQAGDLVESLMKREAGIKDAGSLIPGHGGVLDRFDSIFLAAPFVYVYLRVALAGGG
jgi:phosphatidate cytidylyltransferase